MPDGWSQPGYKRDPSGVYTRTALAQARSTATIPHHSFDLDGDGFVSHRDYFLAKHFDKDGDGKLNAEELATAKKALKDGFANNFVFGLEASARPPTDHKRVTNKINHVRVL